MGLLVDWPGPQLLLSPQCFLKVLCPSSRKNWDRLAVRLLHQRQVNCGIDLRRVRPLVPTCFWITVLAPGWPELLPWEKPLSVLHTWRPGSAWPSRNGFFQFLAPSFSSSVPSPESALGSPPCRVHVADLALDHSGSVLVLVIVSLQNLSYHMAG